MTNENLNENGLLPPIETFTGHSHTLREDIDTLKKILHDAEKRGIAIGIHYFHMHALLYNLECAVNYLDSIGIKTFSEERAHENAYKPEPDLYNAIEGTKRLEDLGAAKKIFKVQNNKTYTTRNGLTVLIESEEGVLSDRPWDFTGRVVGLGKYLHFQTNGVCREGDEYNIHPTKK